MTPEIAERYRRTVDWWRANTPRLPPPLPFEVPEGKKVDIAADIYFGEAYTDDKRFYAEGGGARTGLILLYWMTGVIAFGMAPFTLMAPTEPLLLLPNWLVLLILSGLAYWAWRAEKRVTRKNTVVFERETSKIYVPVDDKTPHIELNFYDQYFYAQAGRVGMNTHANLWLYLPKMTLSDGREVGGVPAPLALVGTEEEALEAWYFLVRYMDTDWPFDEEALDYFEYVAEEKKRKGYKVEDIRRQPGERVFF